MVESDSTSQAHRGWPNGKRRYGPAASKRSGFHELKTTLERLGSRALDPDTEVGRALAAWRAALVADLGGEENLSTQELALVDLAVRDLLLIQSVDGWIFQQPRVINARKKAVYPVVVERMKLAEGFTRRLTALGLARRAKPTPSLAEYLAARASERSESEEPEPDQPSGAA